MRFPSWFLSRAWLIVPVVACAFLVWTSFVHLRHIEYVSGLPVASVTVDAASPTGYADGLRMLLVPERNPASYQWIVQTQQMLAHDEWRVRHVNYDNAPSGREVHAPSPYRWWLGLIAWGSHLWSGAPLGQAVERAALLADPTLHVLLLLSVVIFAVRQVGTLAAALLAVGLAALFPLAGEFLPGQPDDRAFACGCVLWSVLPLLAAFRPAGRRAAIGPADQQPLAHRWFIAAGVFGGLGMWVDVSTQTPILVGLALGGILWSWLARRAARIEAATVSPPPPWRAWAVSGAATTLAAYLFEYFPSHLHVAAWRLEVNHPLYALAWLGGGELLARTTDWIQRGKPAWHRREIVIVTLATLAVVAVPLTMVLHSTRGFLAANILATRLSRLPDGVVAKGLADWIARDGPGGVFVTVAVPLLLLGAAGWILTRRSLAPAHRATVALTVGPVVVALGFAGFRLQWWSTVDSALLALLAAIAVWLDRAAPQRRWLAVVALALALAPGGWRLMQAAVDANDEALSGSEGQSLLERDLAHWMTQQAGAEGVVVLAPPGLTSSLIFFGGVRGLGTPYWENYDGFAAAVRIAGATALAEGESLVRRRSVTHIIVPTWDSTLDDYARLATNKPETALVGLLRRWEAPLWLRPVPYETPNLPVFEGQSVGIFARVDLQEDVTALSRLAEFFVETDRLEFAARVSRTLAEKYPADLGGLVARCQVAAARQEMAGFSTTFKSLLEGLTRGEDIGMPWDRRVNLAIMLAHGKRPDLARPQLQRCLDEIDDPLLRSLTTATLFRLQLLAKALGQEIPDTALRALALRLLPAESRERLQ